MVQDNITRNKRLPDSVAMTVVGKQCDLPLLFFVYFQVNNGVLYFVDYEDNLHHGPLCSRFNVVVKSYL